MPRRHDHLLDPLPGLLTARDLVEHLAAGPEIVYLFWPVITGYLRIVTHPSVLSRPLNAREAISNIEALIATPHVRTPGSELLLDTHNGLN